MKPEELRVTECLIDTFDRMDMVTPSNFNEILEFVQKKVCETIEQEYGSKKNWDDIDITSYVVFSFRKWIESKATK